MLSLPLRGFPRPRRKSGRFWLLAASLPMLTFLLAPLMALLIRALPSQLVSNLGQPAVMQAILLSLMTTFVTVAVTLLLGTPLAYLLARRRFRGRTMLDTLVDLPMILPPSVAGIALLVAFGRRGLLGQYLSDAGIELAFTSAAVVLAQTFVAAPFYIKAAAAGLSQVDPELEQAAALDGASTWQIFWHVTAPLAWVSLFFGAVMTWARALGEFGATIVFAGNFIGRTQTMPLAIYQGFELDLSVALTLSVILLGVSAAVLFVVKRLLAT